MKFENPCWAPLIGFGLGVVSTAASAGRGAEAGPTLETPDPHGIVEWVRTIYADGAWNGTPDIAHWRGDYYVVVNQGKVHPGEDGPGIVLRSSNLQEWEHIYTTSGSAVDCKLLALPERLMFYYLHWEIGEDRYVESRVVYTEDGRRWSGPRRVHQPQHNFWRPKVHDGVIYVASDTSSSRVDLLRSADGFVWEKVSTIVEQSAGPRAYYPWKVTETELVFWPDGELWALTRQNVLSRAYPPYAEWTHWTLGIEGGGIAGPSMLRVGGDVYAAGRFVWPSLLAQGNRTATTLWKYDETAERYHNARFERIAYLPEPAFADMAYAGFVATEDGVFVVYYSGHSYGETGEARETKADIYLAKLKIGRNLRP